MDIWLIVMVVYIVYKLLKEKFEKPRKAMNFDWEAYWADIRNGMTTVQQNKKIAAGGYDTDKPIRPHWFELPLETIVDTERYEFDMKHNPERADYNRRRGYYRYVCPVNEKNPGWQLYFPGQRGFNPW